MASLRIIRKRIRSVHSTQKITKAMKMIAAARLRRSQAKLTEASPYAKKVEELLKDLAGSVPDGLHPLLGHRPVERRLVVVLASDRGLCGAFNANIIRLAERHLLEGAPAKLVCVGKKANGYFTRRGHDMLDWGTQLWTGFTFERAAELARRIARGYVDGEYDRVDVIYNEFKSVISQRPAVVQLIPVERPETAGATIGVERLYEPDRDSIVRALIPRAVDIRFYLACLHSLTSEHGARMTAMDSANRNSREMIDKLTLDMNRARQASITKELMEIIGGAEALK